MWLRDSVAGGIWSKHGSARPSLRPVRFEALETRTLLSATATGAAAALVGDTVLVASVESGESAAWIDSLTPEQAEVREDLLGFMSNDSTVRWKNWTKFEPIPMPEAFLDELYDTYGVKSTWDSLWQWMDGLFGSEVIQGRSDTPDYFTIGEFVSTAEQIRVSELLHGLLDAGGTIDELEGFEPVAMPESFLDELYDTYGDDLVWDCIGPQMLYELFGSHILLNRGETRYYFDDWFEQPASASYDAGAYADNGLADYFDLTRSGDELILTIREDTDPSEEVSLVTRSVVTLDATEAVLIYLHGSSDADVFRIHNLGDYGSEIGVTGVETDSATDTVQVYDTEGDDVWIAREDYCTFTMEGAYRVTTSSVSTQHGYATAGGNDRAYLWGNDSANKVKGFEGDVNLVRLYQGGVYSRAKYFESVHIDGGGDDDRAIFYGTPGDDQLTATKDEGTYESSAAGGFSYVYADVEFVWAYGGSGEDHAIYSDSAVADVVRLRTSGVKIQERGEDASYLSIRQFDTFYAEATTDDGQTDVVKMHDTDSADLLTAETEDGQVRARFYAGATEAAAADLIYESFGFEITKGYSTSEGDVRDVDGVNGSLLEWDGPWEDA